MCVRRSLLTGKCFARRQPNTLRAHSSWASNAYYQAHAGTSGYAGCFFGTTLGQRKHRNLLRGTTCHGSAWPRGPCITYYKLEMRAVAQHALPPTPTRAHAHMHAHWDMQTTTSATDTLYPCESSMVGFCQCDDVFCKCSHYCPYALSWPRPPGNTATLSPVRATEPRPRAHCRSGDCTSCSQYRRPRLHLSCHMAP